MADLNQVPVNIAPTAPRDFEMYERAPATALSGMVRALVGYRETAAGHFRHTQAASLNIPLVISFGETFAIGLGRQPGINDSFGSFAAGLFAGPVVIDSFGAASCIQVDFTPLGARRFFGLPMSELARRMVGLDDVLGAEGAVLRERLAEEADWGQRLAMVEQFVTTRLRPAKRPYAEVEWAYDRLASSGGRATIRSVAAAVGWSRKHLRERFALDIGLAPKTVARIMRFNRALEAARRDGSAGWAGIAADCGYADQAHLVREFRDFAGASPTAFELHGQPG